jgi:uncharacterized protein
MEPDVTPPPAPARALAPVEASERVETIDIIRGLALFGILAANIRAFAGPAVTYFLPHLYWPALHDRIAQAFIDTFVQGKFITIFAFLFGVGFAVQLERAKSRGGMFGWTYARRLAILLLFGLVHGLLIWFGDILLVYALGGFLLLLFRERRDKTIAIWAVVALLWMPLLGTGVFTAVRFGMPAPPFEEPTAAELAKLTATFSEGGWVDIQKQRMLDAVKQNWGFFPFFFPQVLALFLLGMLAWRRRLLQPAPESLPKYRRAMIYGLVIGTLGNAAAVAIKWIGVPPPMPTTLESLAVLYLTALSVPALSLGYVCFIVLLCNEARWRARLQRFAAIGRTALTNYLLQSVIGTLIFYSYGLRLFGTAGPAVLLVLTFVIYAIQSAISPWWLARFRFGPVEWLWRRLTYRGPLPMVREVPAATADAAAA